MLQNKLRNKIKNRFKKIEFYLQKYFFYEQIIVLKLLVDKNKSITYKGDNFE